MRPRDFIQVGMVVTAGLLILYIAIHPPQRAWDEARRLKDVFAASLRDLKLKEKPKTSLYNCGLPGQCSSDQFVFYMKSGAANIIGPKICFEDEVIMSSVKNNIGPGLNIVLINGETGKILKFDTFNMYSGKVEILLKFMKDLQPGTIVLVASFDDPASKLNDEVRNVFVNLGSTVIKSVGFRDGWVFAGITGRSQISAFEKYIKNENQKNTYGGWPEVLELSGCFPRKQSSTNLTT